MLTFPKMIRFARTTPVRFLSSGKTPYERYNMSVVADARMTALSGATNDALMSKLENEFQGERVSATRRAEDRLRDELLALDGLHKEVDAFNAKRKTTLKLRSELIIQREASGLTIDTTNVVEREFPVPPAL
jgi:hypothetical protein